MRLRRLDLTRYGKFDGTSLDFGAAGDGPDLHIVYGPNEAGKSTLLYAYLDLLFGMGRSNAYAFRHSYDSMQVGGCLELAAGPRELVRTKARQNSLRDGRGQPVLDSVLLGALGGLARDSYRAMFSLDDDTLEQGGRDILASKGDLGQLLFAGSAGLSALSVSVQAVRTEVDTIRRMGGRAGALQELKKELEALKDRRDTLDTGANSYKRMRDVQEAAKAANADALAALTRLKGQHTRVTRLLVAWPHADTLRDCQAKLGGYGDLPEVPASWSQDLPTLQKQENEIAIQMSLTTQEVRRLTNELEAITVDPVALELMGDIEPLKELTSRNAGATADLPGVREELAGAAVRLQMLVSEAGHYGADPATLVLTVPQKAAFETLGRKRSGIEAKLIAAKDEMADAAQAVTEARGMLGLGTEPVPAETQARVGAARDGWTSSDHAARCRLSARERDQHADTLAGHMVGLAPWSGDGVALAALAVPDRAVVLGWQEAAKTVAAEIARHQDRLTRLEEELAPLKAAVASDGATTGLMTAQQAAAIRAARDAAWTLHRRTLDDATADAFEAALRHDDSVSTQRLGQERALARLHEAAREIVGKEAGQAQARTALTEAKAQAEQLAVEVAKALAATSPELAGVKAATLPVWLNERDQAVRVWNALRVAERDLAQTKADEAARHLQLRDALTQAAVPFDAASPGDALAVLARATLNRAAAAQLLHENLAAAEKTLREREGKLARASQAEASWQAEWRAACSATWVGAEAAAAPVETTLAIVATADKLRAALDTHHSFAKRIQEMENVQEAFVAETNRLAAALCLEEDAPLTETVATILSRVHGAGQAAEALDSLTQQSKAASDALQTAQQAQAAHDLAAGTIKQALGVQTLMEAQTKLRAVADKAEIGRRADQAEQALRTGLHVGTMTEALAMLDGQDRAALEAEADRLATERDQAELRTNTSAAALQTASDDIGRVGGDDVVARLESIRCTTLLEIEDVAQRYLRLRIGLAAAERALRAYRDQHRAPMLEGASRAFNAISQGAYRALQTQAGTEGETLVALPAEGGSKTADALSKGTRFQLYLSLRAAGYRQFVTQHGPVPFVADDIMETFDDGRAEETLRVLGDMAALGQVIYLTHHAHLVEIARRTVPGVRVQTL